MTKSFKEATELDPNTLMIVDSLNLCFRYRGKSKYKEDFMDTVESLRRSYKAGKVIIGADWGSSSYRKGIYPLYKENRKKLRELQTPAEAEAFKLFFEEYERTLQEYQNAAKYPVLRYSKTECDDICAYICTTYRRYGVKKIWLISSDKDYDLLVNEDISRFSYVTRKEVTAANWHTHYDYAQEDHISIKCLMGDASDGVPGVAGIGPKRAAELVKQYGTAMDIYSSLPIQSKYKYIKSLNESEDLILLNYKLMDLVTYAQEAIGNENVKDIDKRIEEYVSRN